MTNLAVIGANATVGSAIVCEPLHRRSALFAVCGADGVPRSKAPQVLAGA
ncbi:hypothetical protein [Streptomyces sp. NPDC046939]